MSINKTPGFNYYEIPFKSQVKLPKGFGITKLTKDVIGFYAEFFKEDGTDATLHDVEITETPQGWSIVDKTLQMLEKEKINLRAEIARNMF